MITLLIAFLITSHLLAAVPFWRRVRAGAMPGTSDFASLSFIVYYDISMPFRILFPDIREQYFTPLADASDGVLTLALFILASAPWLFHVGSYLATKRVFLEGTQPKSRLNLASALIFYGLCIAVCLPLVKSGIEQITSGEEIWSVRNRVGREWGPLIVIVYLPLHLLAFYVGQANSRTKLGLFVSLGLAAATVASTAVIGQRTIVLLPFLILAIFRLKLSGTRIVLAASGGLLGAALLLSIFKWQYNQSGFSTSELVAQTVVNDFSRDGVLASTLEATEPIGTRILAYPMAGYAYCALFFVPRSLAPMKGFSTAQYFTSYMVGTSVESTEWGFGIGAIEEILLNGGFLLFVPLMLLYGVVMRLLDQASSRIPSLIVPTRLGAIWLCGYNLAALMLLFGTMFLVALALHYALVAWVASRSTEAGFELHQPKHVEVFP